MPKEKGIFSKGLGTVGEKINDGLDTVGDVVEDTIDSVGDGIKTGYEAVGSGIEKGYDIIGDGIEGGLGAAGKGLDNGVNFVGNTASTIDKDIGNAASFVGEGVGDIASDIGDSVDDVASNIGNGFNTIGNNIGKGLAMQAGLVQSAFNGNLLNDGIKTAEKIGNGIGSLVSDQAKASGDIFNEGQEVGKENPIDKVKEILEEHLGKSEKENLNIGQQIQGRLLGMTTNTLDGLDKNMEVPLNDGSSLLFNKNEKNGNMDIFSSDNLENPLASFNDGDLVSGKIGDVLDKFSKGQGIQRENIEISSESLIDEPAKDIKMPGLDGSALGVASNFLPNEDR